MPLPSAAFAQFQNLHGPSFSNQSHVWSQGLTLLIVPLLLTTLHTCTTIFSPPPMLILLMSFMEISFLVINSACSVLGDFGCTFLIKKSHMVKSFHADNQITGASSSLGKVLLIKVKSLLSWTLPQGIFPLSSTWSLMTPSSPFSIYLMMMIPQYYVKMFPLNHSHIKYCWNLGIVPYSMINDSLPLNGSRNAGEFNESTTCVPLINPPRLPFVFMRLSILCIIQSLVPLLIILSFRVNHLLHLCLLLFFSFSNHISGHP